MDMRLVRRVATLPVVLALALSAPLDAQSPVDTASAARFSVVSIKRNVSDSEAQTIRTVPGGSLDARNVALPLLLTYAFNIAPFQIEGLPSWSKDRFDIAARTENAGPAPNWRGMVKAMLQDRFRLVTHTAAKDGAVFALTATQRSSPASGLHPTGVDCPETDPACGVHLGQGRIQGMSVTMPQIAFALGRLLGRPVVDATGLRGRFDVLVEYDPTSVNLDAAPDGGAPSLAAALQESLGLRLESRRAPIEVLVIDRAELPEPN
jgi:uncharacterized protein (TIGR03435 family)